MDTKEWLRESNGLLRGCESELRLKQLRLERLQSEVSVLVSKVEGFKDVIQAYKVAHGISEDVQETDEVQVRVNSGVRAAVKELKDKNPQMTKQDVLNHLVSIGFDFGGKQKSKAVNIVWSYLGYDKVEKGL